MRRLVILSALLLLAFVASAAVVRGVVRDSSGVAVGYATVAAEQLGVVQVAIAADSEGRFELSLASDGSYVIEISAVGYQSVKHQVAVAGDDILLGDIVLSEGVAVDAVAVTIQKPIVTADAEKLSYSVEDDPEAQSSTLEEIILKIPQLSIDADGKVLMNGQSDYKILVNGRAAGALGRNFNDIIKSMPASSIKRIEVITNPSMKYDAEGAGGVLNIITSKAKFDGYNGNVNLSGGSYFNRNYFGQFSGNVAIQKDKLSLSATVSVSGADADNDVTGLSDSKMHILNPNSPYSQMNKTSGHYWGGGSIYANINMGYQIDTLNLITVEASYWTGRWDNRGNSATNYFDADNNLFNSHTGTTESSNLWNGVDLLLAYEHTFKDKQEHTLTVSEYITLSPPTDVISLENIVYPDGTTTDYNTHTVSDALQNVFQADYNNKWGKHSLEAGVKHTFDRSSLVQSGDDSNVATTTNLDKNIAAIYGGYALNLKSFTARAGARLEGAWYNSQTSLLVGQTESYKSSLVNAVPYLSLSYKPAEGHSLSLSYSERLSRPGVTALSPYVTQTATLLSYGNPDLKTGVSHSVRLKYAWMNNKWTISPEFMTMFSNNRVANYTFVDDNGMMNQTYLNHGRTRAYVLSTSLSFRPSQRFSLSADVRAGYFEEGIPQQNVAVAGWAFSESVNMTIGLWKGARLTLSEYLAKHQPQQSSVSTNWFLTTSARLGQKLLKDKLEISLSVQNPHSRTLRFDSQSISPSYVMDQSWVSINRSIRLSVSYRFGKQGVVVKRTHRKSDSTTENIGSSNTSGQMGS